MHEPPRLDGERVRLSAPDETGGAAQEVEAEYDVAHSANEMHAGLEVELGWRSRSDREPGPP